MAVTLSRSATLRIGACVIVLAAVSLDATSTGRRRPHPSATSRVLDTSVVDHIPGGGPDGGRVSSVVVAATRPATVFAALAAGGVFKSSDHGVTWTPADRGLPGDASCDLAAVPAEPDTLYAACNNDGLFKTTNGGTLWRQLNLDYADVPIEAPSDSNVLYIPGWDDIVRSRNGGARWEHIKTPARTCASFVIDPVAPSMLVCGSERQIMVSRNAGVRWRAVAAIPEGTITALAIGPSDRRVMVTGTSDGRFFKTNDGGGTWKASSAVSSDKAIDRLWFTAPEGSTMFALQDSTILRSLDAGDTWAVVPVTWTIEDFDAIDDIAVDPFSPSTIYVGTRTGVMVTTDGGQHWDSRRRGITRMMTTVTFRDEASPILYAHGWFETFASRDNGDTWTVVPNADRELVPARTRGSMAVFRTTPGTTEGAFEFSTDGGQQWRSSQLATGQLPSGIVAAAGNARVVYVSVFGRLGGFLGGSGIWRTRDAGDTWQLVFDRPIHSFGRCCELVADPNDEDVVYAVVNNTGVGGSGSSIWRTTDGGTTWDQLPAMASALLLVPTVPTTVLVQHYSTEGPGRYELITSTDRGRTWTRVGKGLPANTDILNMVADPRQPTRIFAGTDGRGVFRSTDAGVTWEPAGLVR